MLILYITYVDINSGTSGSSVRPQKMYRALLDAGHEVKLLSGAQQRWGRKARTEAVQEIRRWLRETGRISAISNLPLCRSRSAAISLLSGKSPEWEFPSGISTGISIGCFRNCIPAGQILPAG